MLEIITDYLEILSYLAVFGAIATLADNLIHKRMFREDLANDKLNSSLAQSLNDLGGSTSGTTAKVASSSRLEKHLNLAQDTRISCSTCVSNSDSQSNTIAESTHSKKCAMQTQEQESSAELAHKEQHEIPSLHTGAGELLGDFGDKIGVLESGARELPSAVMTDATREQSPILAQKNQERNFFKIILFYIVSAIIGATISAGIYLLCEVVFFLPFYVQFPLSVLCAYFAFDIVFALKSARALYKSLERLPIPTLDVRLVAGWERNELCEYMLLDSISVGEVSVPKNFVFRGFRRYFLLRYICPSDSITIGAFMVAEYMECMEYPPQKRREALLSILLSKKGIFATILAFMCYVFVSVRHKEG